MACYIICELLSFLVSVHSVTHALSCAGVHVGSRTVERLLSPGCLSVVSRRCLHVALCAPMCASSHAPMFDVVTRADVRVVSRADVWRRHTRRCARCLAPRCLASSHAPMCALSHAPMFGVVSHTLMFVTLHVDVRVFVRGPSTGFPSQTTEGSDVHTLSWWIAPRCYPYSRTDNWTRDKGTDKRGRDRH